MSFNDRSLLIYFQNGHFYFYFGEIAGDRSGILRVRQGNKAFLSTIESSTFVAGNIEIESGAILSLPPTVTIAGSRVPSMNVHGTCLGIHSLRMFIGSSLYLQKTGQTSCVTCSFTSSNTTGFPGQFLFGSVILMKSSYLTVYSQSTDIISNSIHLYVDVMDLENTAYVSADVLQIIALKYKIELNAKLTLDERGYSSSSGPGKPSCGSCAGAGHGGKGGKGYAACGSCYNGA